MSDNITYYLGEKQIQRLQISSLYPVKDVVPYLTRRAQEKHQSCLGQTGRELSLLKKELERRKEKINSPLSINL